MSCEDSGNCLIPWLEYFDCMWPASELNPAGFYATS
jgi:hypothetical protein